MTQKSKSQRPSVLISPTRYVPAAVPPIHISPWMTALGAVLGWLFWVVIIATLAKVIDVVFKHVLPPRE